MSEQHTAENDASARMSETVTKPSPSDENARHQRNGHTLELDGCMWRCLQCRHWFDAAVDADLFWCGDDCTGKHPEDRLTTPTPNGDPA